MPTSTTAATTATGQATAATAAATGGGTATRHPSPPARARASRCADAAGTSRIRGRGWRRGRKDEDDELQSITVSMLCCVVIML